MPDEFVTVATCSQPFEAEVIRGRLESAGISARVTSRGLMEVYIGAGFSGGGGVAVQVAEPDVARAKDLLSEPVDFGDDDLLAPQCPACGSYEVSNTPAPSGLLAIVMELLPRGAATPPEMAYHCEACGRDWTE
jgi:hypothetical protein